MCKSLMRTRFLAGQHETAPEHQRFQLFKGEKLAFAYLFNALEKQVTDKSRC